MKIYLRFPGLCAGLVNGGSGTLSACILASMPSMRLSKDIFKDFLLLWCPDSDSFVRTLIFSRLDYSHLYIIEKSLEHPSCRGFVNKSLFGILSIKMDEEWTEEELLVYVDFGKYLPASEITDPDMQFKIIGLDDGEKSIYSEINGKLFSGES